MSFIPPEVELEICLDKREGFWRDFREITTKLNSEAYAAAEREILANCSDLSAAQRQRRGWLDSRSRSLEHLRTTDPTQLKLGVRTLRRYRDELTAEFQKLCTLPVSTKVLEVFKEEILYSEDYAFCLEEALQAMGAARTRVDDILEPITTKIQLKIALKNKFDELKEQTPIDLHYDLEKAFRQAMEQLDKR